MRKFIMQVLASLVLVIGFGITAVTAHDTGSVSPKDGCHRQDGARHYNSTDGTAAGACYKHEGINYRVPVAEVVDRTECLSMLRWVAGERTNADGDYIGYTMFGGNPILMQSDADKLVRACR